MIKIFFLFMLCFLSACLNSPTVDFYVVRNVDGFTATYVNNFEQEVCLGKNSFRNVRIYDADTDKILFPGSNGLYGYNRVGVGKESSEPNAFQDSPILTARVLKYRSEVNVYDCDILTYESSGAWLSRPKSDLLIESLTFEGLVSEN